MVMGDRKSAQKKLISGILQCVLERSNMCAPLTDTDVCHVVAIDFMEV